MRMLARRTDTRADGDRTPGSDRSVRAFDGSETDDAALAEGLRRGDAESAHRLFERALPPLYRHAREALGHRQHAVEPVVTATLAEALRTVDLWPPRTPLLPWLLALCDRELERAGAGPRATDASTGGLLARVAFLRGDRSER
jgi:hypothetical protein